MSTMQILLPKPLFSIVYHTEIRKFGKKEIVGKHNDRFHVIYFQPHDFINASIKKKNKDKNKFIVTLEQFYFFALSAKP